MASAEVIDDIHADVAAVYDSAQLIALEMFVGFYIGHSHVVRAEALSFEEGEFLAGLRATSGSRRFSDKHLRQSYRYYMAISSLLKSFPAVVLFADSVASTGE